MIVTGDADAAAIARIRTELERRGAVVRLLDERGKWPHIRSNWVTGENGVLQVSSRTAQPWIENNAALIRIARAMEPGTVPLISYKRETRKGRTRKRRQ